MIDAACWLSLRGAMPHDREDTEADDADADSNHRQ